MISENEKQPRISICIPTYEMHGKGAGFLKESFEKLTTQTFTDFEVVISDHSQNNDIKAVCDEFSDRLTIIYLKNEENRGSSSANINNAIRHANGVLIKILFQDDFLYSNSSLADISENFDAEKDHWFITACEHTKDGVHFNRPFYPKYHNKIHLGNNTISSPSVLTIINKSPLLFDTNLIWFMDCDYYKRYYDKYGLPKILNSMNVVNRIGEHQITNTLASEKVKEKEYWYMLKKFNEKNRTAIMIIKKIKKKARSFLNLLKKKRNKMTRSQLINLLIKKNDYKSYLEIGVNTPAQPGWNFDSVEIDVKHGVDPAEKVNATYKMPSDDFFAKHIKMKYDIVFVDGLHIFEQAYRDIVNSLEHLNEGGTIVVHDSNPTKEITQRRERASNVWHGDVWRAILKLRTENSNVEIFTVDTDEGCTIIQKGSQQLFSPNGNSDIASFDFFDKNRKEILNLISVDEFRKRISGSATVYNHTQGKTLALVAVTSPNIPKTLLALEISMNKMRYDEILLISHEKPENLNPRITFIQCERLKSVNDYNKFMLYDLARFVKSDFALIVQYDGFIVRPWRWDNQFLEYDYIGAPWSKDLYFTEDGENVRVGNGGFSLRSKKLLNVFNDLGLPFTDNGTGYFNEDGAICLYHRKKLQEFGIKFAPVSIASKFSKEKKCSDSDPKPFGYHKYMDITTRLLLIKFSLKKKLMQLKK